MLFGCLSVFALERGLGRGAHLLGDVGVEAFHVDQIRDLRREDALEREEAGRDELFGVLAADAFHRGAASVSA